jgi:hypothetical protein
MESVARSVDASPPSTRPPAEGGAEPATPSSRSSSPRTKRAGSFFSREQSIVKKQPAISPWGCLDATRVSSINGQSCQGMRAVEVQALYEKAKTADTFSVIFEK